MARDDDRPRRRDRDEDDRPRRRDYDRDEEVDDLDDVPSARPPRRAPRSSGGDGFATLVPYRNGPALAAYYCGVFGLIPFLGFLLGPIAMILGVIGIMKKKKDPRVHGTGHAIAGIVLGVIDVALWPIVVFVLREKLN